jgi:hypothetical protein
MWQGALLGCRDAFSVTAPSRAIVRYIGSSTKGSEGASWSPNERCRLAESSSLVNCKRSQEFYKLLGRTVSDGVTFSSKEFFSTFRKDSSHLLALASALNRRSCGLKVRAPTKRDLFSLQEAFSSRQNSELGARSGCERPVCACMGSERSSM